MFVDYLVHSSMIILYFLVLGDRGTSSSDFALVSVNRVLIKFFANKFCFCMFDLHVQLHDCWSYLLMSQSDYYSYLLPYSNIFSIESRE